MSDKQTDHMPAEVATHMLLNDKKMSNRMRKVCKAARASVMLPALPGEPNAPIVCEDRSERPRQYRYDIRRAAYGPEKIAGKLRLRSAKQLFVQMKRAIMRRDRAQRLLGKTQTPLLQELLQAKVNQQEFLRVSIRYELERRKALTPVVPSEQ